MKGSSNSMWPIVQRDRPDEVTNSADWRSQVPAGARQRIINVITNTLERHLLISTPEAFDELTRIATRFEDKVYTSATSQVDYLRKISRKMLRAKQMTPGGAHDSERKEAK